MCLILFAWQTCPDYPLVVAANRDEFFGRPTRGARFWPEHPDLLAGQDLDAGGTWMGLTRRGRFAAVTNIRGGGTGGPRSRGTLCTQFLHGDASAADFANTIHAERHDYRPFNLLVCDGRELWLVASASAPPRPVQPGVHGISNAVMDEPWPKVERGRAALAAQITATPDPEALLALLGDTRQPPDAQLPDTGIGLARERLLAPLFVATDGYGTRASTALLLGDDHAVYCEQEWLEGARSGSRACFQVALRDTTLITS